MGYAATADPACRVELQALRSQIRAPNIRSWRKRRIRTEVAVKNLADLLKVSSGIALRQTEAPLNGSTRPVLVMFSDAAMDLQAKFAGYGFWFWEPGAGMVHYDFPPENGGGVALRRLRL
eukprot:COSAG01_NODE_19567_length_1003_cov_1.231195_1_plen_120_part_00